jgi:hypothetical protein
MTSVVLILALTSPGAGDLPPIAIARDGRGFVLASSGQRFVPWGLNYGNAGRLVEDFWESEWPTLTEDFGEMKDLGANVVRIHLQLGKFMKGPDRPNGQALDRLARLVAEAELAGLYLDVTGLGCYRKADVPDWYDTLDEAGRWAAQARFWEAVAARCSQSPAIFCYDLLNEPIAPADPRRPGQWYSGKLFGGYDFIQWIALDPAGRPREEIARRWIKTLTRAIRKHDPRHLITVGLLPSTPEWGHFSGFVPERIASDLDFISVHIYPVKGKGAEALTTLKGFAVGKPVVIEETFTLTCSAPELEEFLRQSQEFACGWLGHYDGQTIEQLESRRQAKTLTIAQALWLDWLTLFRKAGPVMKVEKIGAASVPGR